MKNLIITSLIILFIPIFLSAQGKEIVQGLYSNVIESLEKKDWKSLDKHCIKLINTVKSSDYDDLVSIVSYMHIYSVSALMNDRKLTKKEALKKARAYKGKILIMPGHPFIEKCVFNCIYPKNEEAKELFCTSADERGTLIYSFEYYELKEALSQKFIEESEGKIMKIRARLKEIDVRGQMLPRFNLRFDKVEYKVVDDAENEEEIESDTFADSLEVYLKNGVYINTSDNHLVKMKEFLDTKRNVASALFTSHSGSTKTSFGIEVISLEPDKDINDYSEEMNHYIESINEKGVDENVTLTRKVQKLEWPFFLGFDMVVKENNAISTNYSANGMWYKDDHACKVFFAITDTLGNTIPDEQSRNILKLILDGIIIKEKPLNMEKDKSISKERELLFKNIKIGLDRTKCDALQIEKKCVQIFVENTGNFSLIDVTSDAFDKANKHEDKGFIIPHLPNAMIKLVFNNGTETIELPFTIPNLTEK